jgi:hypothetical protein
VGKIYTANPGPDKSSPQGYDCNRMFVGGGSFQECESKTPLCSPVRPSIRLAFAKCCIVCTRTQPCCSLCCYVELPIKQLTGCSSIAFKLYSNSIAFVVADYDGGNFTSWATISGPRFRGVPVWKRPFCAVLY